VVVADGALLEADVLSGIISEARPDGILPVGAGEPRVEAVALLAEALRPGDAVIAVGGGSTLDSAKLAGAVAVSSHPLEHHLLGATPLTGSLPVVAVPTTAGSGAEVTRTAVVSLDGRKSWAWGDHLRPDAAVHDAALTLTLPESTTVASGVDAFVHAIESAASQTRNPPSEATAVWAAGEIADVLPAVLTAPDDLARRRRMLLAACAAGIGIDRCGVGIGHAIGHALGSVVAVTHGFAVMLGTLVAIEWIVAGGDERLDTVAAAMRPGAAAVDLPGLARELAAAVDLTSHVGRQAAEQPLDATTLVTELARPEHAPMLRNSTVKPSAADLEWLATDTATAWNEAAGRR
jgi:alcohol dehydrogenase class IV